MPLSADTRANVRLTNLTQFSQLTLSGPLALCTQANARLIFWFDPVLWLDSVRWQSQANATPTCPFQLTRWANRRVYPLWQESIWPGLVFSILPPKSFLFFFFFFFLSFFFNEAPWKIKKKQKKKRRQTGKSDQFGQKYLHVHIFVKDVVVVLPWAPQVSVVVSLVCRSPLLPFVEEECSEETGKWIRWRKKFDTVKNRLR